MKYYVEYNGNLRGMYNSLNRALAFVVSKGYINSDNDLLRVYDSVGNEYDPNTGEMLDEIQ